MPQGVSIREFARRDGCSHTAVQDGVKRGALKPFEDGSLDPQLVGTGWRAGNYKLVRGGKPRTVKRQPATERQPAAGEVAASEVDAAPIDDLVATGYWSGERAAGFRLGVLTTLSDFGSSVPAVATEVARRRGFAEEDIEALFAELVLVFRGEIAQALIKEGVSSAEATAFYDPDDGGPFLPTDDFRRPGEDEEARWARIVR